jgi:hypothetical protein
MNDLTLATVTETEIPMVGADTPDAGSLAREKLQTKQSLLRRMWFWTKVQIAVVVLVAAAVLGYFVNDAYKNRVTQVVTDMRPCVVDVGGEKVTGVREYQYNYFDIFGIRIIDTAKIEVSTTIEYKGNDAVVFGIGGSEGWWSMKTSEGEYGKMKTKPAQTYAFYVKGRTAVIDSNKFCK